MFALMYFWRIGTYKVDIHKLNRHSVVVKVFALFRKTAEARNGAVG